MIRNFKSILLLLVLFSIALCFFFQPFSLLTTTEERFPRWFFFLMPIADPEVIFTQIWGETGVHLADLNRLKIVGVGLAEFVLLYSVGRFLLVILRLSSAAHSKYGAGFRLNKMETAFFSLPLGMAVVSVLLSWIGFFGGIGSYLAVPLWGMALGGTAVFIFRFGKDFKKIFQHKPQITFFGTAVGVILLLFAGLYLTAGTIPPFEYDMLEYHAQGAREIAETGRIGFFEHNVYLNMPLGTEMIYLAGILMNPFRSSQGADTLLLGVTSAKFTLSFIPLFTALGTAAFVRRFSAGSGSDRYSVNVQASAAAFTLLAFPELFQVSANGLNDTVLGLLILGTIYSLFLTVKSSKSETGSLPFPLLFLAGFLTGFAASCKYTAIPFLLFPAAVLLGWIIFRAAPHRWIKETLFFGGSTLLGSGAWYLKNGILTGNPFYPLGFSIFGDKTGVWNELKNERWTAAHSSDSFGISQFCSDAARLFTDDFAGLLFPLFAILIALFFVQSLKKKNISIDKLLVLYALFFFLVWWFATHRLLRFLTPVLPVATLLTASAWSRARNGAQWKAVRIGFELLLVAGGIYAFSLDLTTTSGFLAPIAEIAQDSERYGTSAVLINQNPSLVTGTDSDHPLRLLLVGDARGFAYRNLPILYNTCWDNSRFRSLIPDWEKSHSRGWKWSPKETEEIKQRFCNAKIGAVLVDKREIRRFLSPGNYGLTDKEIMEPGLFESLQKAGILKEEKLADNVEFYKVNPDILK